MLLYLLSWFSLLTSGLEITLLAECPQEWGKIKGQKYFLEAANLMIKGNPTLKFFLVGGSSGDPALESELRDKICEYGIAPLQMS